MENHTRTELALVTRRAREDSRFRFTSLAHLLNVEFLRECYKSLGKEKACGIDGVPTVAVAGVRLKSRVWEIHKHGSVRGVEAGSTVRSCGTLDTERQEQLRTQTIPKEQGHTTSTRPMWPRTTWVEWVVFRGVGCSRPVSRGGDTGERLRQRRRGKENGPRAGWVRDPLMVRSEKKRGYSVSWAFLWAATICCWTFGGTGS